MLFLVAASLFFFPPYIVTFDEKPSSLVTDAKGNAYVVSFDYNTTTFQFLGNISKVDPNGRLMYRTALPEADSITGIVLTPDREGNVYGGSRRGLGEQHFGVGSTRICA